METPIADTETKKKIFSAIQPSGMLTLGNFLGALKNWVAMQEEYDCTYAVADLHAITVRQEPAKLKAQILETFAILLAIGLEPHKCLMFIQSQVCTHAEMAWLLNCYTQFGELARMTQFKDKSGKHPENINAGLFSYPALMAGDILLYQADLVPVGADQKQHLEISRTIAERFNGIYGNVFTIPDPYISKIGAKVMSLQEPTKKMSKSDSNSNSWVAILDKPEDIMKKFKRAVTDSEAKVYFGDGKDGINNLMTIYSSVSGLAMEQIEGEFAGKGYGDFKVAVGEAVVEALRPVRERFEELIKDKAYLESLYKDGAERAFRVSSRTLAKAKKKIGFVL